eukprot:SM000019S04993  [mRNA]  locus=s19:369492:370280:- [translate_table: standard]
MTEPQLSATGLHVVEAIDGEALAEVELVGGGALDAGVEREEVAALGARGGLGGGDHGGADAAGALGGRRHEVVHVQHLAAEGLPQHSPADDADAGELRTAAAASAAAAHIAVAAAAVAAVVGGGGGCGGVGGGEA